jgi:hypothetical protein
VVRDKNQWLHIELGNSENGKEPLKQELVELGSQLETERADREESQVEVSKFNQNFAPATTLFEKLYHVRSIDHDIISRNTTPIK